MHLEGHTAPAGNPAGGLSGSRQEPAEVNWKTVLRTTVQETWYRRSSKAATVLALPRWQRYCPVLYIQEMPLTARDLPDSGSVRKMYQARRRRAFWHGGRAVDRRRRCYLPPSLATIYQVSPRGRLPYQAAMRPGERVFGQPSTP